MKRDTCHFVTKIMSVACPSLFDVRNDRLIQNAVVSIWVDPDSKKIMSSYEYLYKMLLAEVALLTTHTTPPFLLHLPLPYTTHRNRTPYRTAPHHTAPHHTAPQRTAHRTPTHLPRFWHRHLRHHVIFLQGCRSLAHHSCRLHHPRCAGVRPSRRVLDGRHPSVLGFRSYVRNTNCVSHLYRKRRVHEH